MDGYNNSVLTLQQWTTPDHTCAYLPDRAARLEYEIAMDFTPEEYEARMNAGWRKFGHLLFHPVCAGCRACQPIRIDVAGFTPDRSQRRALRRNEDTLEIRFAPPIVDAARLNLYNRYHADQEHRKEWPRTEKDADDYAFSFVHSPTPVIEISVWEQNLLRAIVLNDVTPNTVSGIYHFHDPDLRDRSLGVFAMLQTIKLARRLQKPWAYFGFYVAGCSSLEYKARFRPCELRDVEGGWRAFSGEDVEKE